ncbi:uncharacterized protein LOC119996147 [Tripterygium wilfordii]|uniref:uncharacterized protein LOC119996147 n=1 Tax=Tripterygium wilfordii TaxID=458696 RepID=UPI0018F8012E|nr:uncharacterized protein LOC119996147 [Tripterygium wilfordii]
MKQFPSHGLSVSSLRGQGYDGLILVAIAREHPPISSLFDLVSLIVNVVGASCKRRDMIPENQTIRIIETLSSGEISSGRGLYQESIIRGASDTRWDSHYGTLLSLISLFSSVMDVLDAVVEDGATSDKKGHAFNLSKVMQSFEFVFNLHLMRILLGITNDLSQELQRKDQDIVNAMTLVRISKERLQLMRNEGCTFLINEVSSFYGKNNIEVPNMDDVYLPQGRSRRRAHGDANLHHYRNDTFNMLIRLAQFYPKDFSDIELLSLADQLESFVIDVCSSIDFSKIKGISDLAQQMIDTKRHNLYTLVYRLLSLALILPIATATVERTFSAMKIVKNRL